MQVELTATDEIAVRDYSDQALGDSGVSAVIGMLKANSPLTHLYLRRNNIGPQGALAVANFLLSHQTLKVLSLSQNPIGNEGAVAIAEALKQNVCLEELYLAVCDIAAQGAIAFGSALQKNKNLRILNLRENPLDNTGAIYLFQAFSLNYGLYQLHLDDICLTDLGMKELSRELTNNTSLTSLYLSHNAISDDGVEHLINGLDKNTSLRKLDLNYNYVTDLGALRLGKFIKQNHSLTALYLGHNVLTQDGVALIFQAVINNSVLQAVNMDGYPLTRDTLPILAKVISTTKNLKKISLDDVSFEGLDIKQLKKALAENTTLTEFVIDDQGNDKCSKLIRRKINRNKILHSNEYLSEKLRKNEDSNVLVLAERLEVIDRDITAWDVLCDQEWLDVMKEIQNSFEQQIETEKKEYKVLSNKQAEVEKSIVALQMTLSTGMTSQGIEVQALRQQFLALQQQCIDLGKQQNFLRISHEEKVQRNTIIQTFSAHPNLILYYRTLQIKLEEIFISFKAVAGGWVDAASSNMGIVKSIVEFFGSFVTLLPIIGPIIDKIFIKTAANVVNKLVSVRQKNIAINASALANLSEVQQYAECISRHLTERYAEQLQLIATPDEAKSQHGIFKKVQSTLTHAKEIAPAKQLAAFAIMWMFVALQDDNPWDETQPLDAQLLQIVYHQSLPNKVTKFWNALMVALKCGGILAQEKHQWVRWSASEIYQLPGIKTKNGAFFKAKHHQPEKYGYRLGTDEEINQLQSGSDKRVHDISSVTVRSGMTSPAFNRELRQLSQLTLEQGEQVERLQRTTPIIDRVRQKSIDDLNERIEKQRKKTRKQVRKILDKNDYLEKTIIEQDQKIAKLEAQHEAITQLLIAHNQTEMNQPARAPHLFHGH
ncbi:MAG: hypothetical protein A3F17_05480 [Gammaproteobacteria bacterium RIFCSPHIGHO2_12_FULL_41_15]|nr:MAG: hypothetical protein A3F17_05480 [Gammaproteobacteria bacterium RIFCSPHIGHO2_12_FULL_41_15]